MKHRCRGRARCLVLGIAALAAAAGLAASGAAPPGNRAGESNRDLSSRLADVLAAVPADAVPTGLLSDRVVEFVGFAGHAGEPGERPLTLAEWRQLYTQIKRSAVGQRPWAALQDLELQTGSTPQRGVIPVAILDLNYDRIRIDALETGALTIRNGRVTPGTGSFFETRRLFAASALQDWTYHGESVSFRADRANHFTNGHTQGPLPAGDLTIDFDDGSGFVRVSWGHEHTVRYLTPGGKTVRVRLVDPDGVSHEAAFCFDVRRLRTPAPHDTLHIQATIPYLGGLGTGEAYVYLAHQHAVLTDPVVVIEGFDLDNSMNWDELYELLNREELLETLRARGYDAVVLNFTDAVDYIQRNAFVAVELLAQVRAAIEPQRTIALAGASMGGLVGRFALAYMEAYALEYAVRNFISFDAPQDGANVPLGLQYWLWFFASESPEAAALLAALDAPGARQMLCYHHTDPPGTTGQSDPLRAQLLADFAALGEYPDLLRKVAIINGSGTQMSQGFQAGQQIIRWEYSSFLVDIIGNVWAVPDGSAQTIFHGLIDIILLPEEEVIVTVSGTRPYDNAPGGWRDSMAELDATAAPYGDIVALHPNHCFIPSVSALHIATEDLFYDIAGDPQLLSHTPFDAVYFPLENEEHVAITPASAAWFIAEVEVGAAGVAEGPTRAAPVASLAAPVPSLVAGATKLRLSVPAAGYARVIGCDATGREVAVLAEREFPAGESELRWSGLDRAGRRLPAGVYFLHLRGAGFSAARRVIVP